MKKQVSAGLTQLSMLGRAGLAIGLIASFAWSAQADDRIRPFSENPYFWQYQGEPVLLIGASDQDNLFNHPDVGTEGLEAHLDLLAASGGNYVRNTMSSRDEGNPWAFALNEETGQYDLNEMGEEFWSRFKNFLNWTAERDIIVQIEVFDRFDYAREPWQRNPFNPRNNMTYTAQESDLPEVITSHPGQRENPFFRSVPELDNNTAILPFQEAFVDKMLSFSLAHGHVLYCISNETNEEEEWGAYWANYIRDAADEAGVEVHVTEMWDPWNLSHPMHNRTFDNPELYTYVDISQNNHQTGQTQWDNAQEQRQRLADSPRPINNVKMYGGTVHGGGYEEGLRKLWRNVLGGMASARYHRPGALTAGGPQYGAGLSEEAQAYLRSARLLMDEIGWPAIEPGLDFVELVVDPPMAVKTEKTHVAYTRDTDGQARLFVNGEEAAAAEVGGDLSPWGDELRLAVANELTGIRPWLGALHHVAGYQRALDPSEIADHYDAGTPHHLNGLQVQYAFDEREGTIIYDISGHTPALDLHIENLDAVTWLEDGLEVRDSVLIATEHPAERLAAAVKNRNAFTLEAWITPAEEIQSGPARIVTLSANHDARNFTLGQTDNAYEMRLRTTETSANGLPSLQVSANADASVAAARSLEGDRAVIFVSHGGLIAVDMEQLQEGLNAEWFDPLTAERHEAAPTEGGNFQPPSRDDWLLVLK